MPNFISEALEVLDLSYRENGALPILANTTGGGFEPLRTFNFEVRLLGMETAMLSAQTCKIDFKANVINLTLRHFEDAKETERIIDFLHTNKNCNIRLVLLDSCGNDMLRYWFMGVNLTGRSIHASSMQGLVVSDLALAYDFMEVKTLAELSMSKCAIEECSEPSIIKVLFSWAVAPTDDSFVSKRKLTRSVFVNRCRQHYAQEQCKSIHEGTCDPAQTCRFIPVLEKLPLSFEVSFPVETLAMLQAVHGIQARDEYLLSCLGA